MTCNVKKKIFKSFLQAISGLLYILYILYYFTVIPLYSGHPMQRTPRLQRTKTFLGTKENALYSGQFAIIADKFFRSRRCPLQRGITVECRAHLFFRIFLVKTQLLRRATFFRSQICNFKYAQPFLFLKDSKLFLQKSL